MMMYHSSWQSCLKFVKFALLMHIYGIEHDPFKSQNVHKKYQDKSVIFFCFCIYCKSLNIKASE